MKREIKVTTGQRLAEAFKANDSFFLLEFKKMPVAQSVELRKLLRKNAYTFKVVKNRIALRALPSSVPAEVRPFFVRPSAIAFADHDPIGLARILREFAVQAKTLTVKAGVVEGLFLDGERFPEIAKLGSRNDLLARFGAVLAHPLRHFQTTWQAPLSGLGRLLTQLKNQK
ncbi:MAG: 50S ribosomal protein L10 [Candidatus Aminicenantes bacterium]|nr:50S ribosomal protein L10 [Candidatus Aminicenantes bacterium]